MKLLKKWIESLLENRSVSLCRVFTNSRYNNTKAPPTKSRGSIFKFNYQYCIRLHYEVMKYLLIHTPKLRYLHISTYENHNILIVEIII